MITLEKIRSLVRANSNNLASLRAPLLFALVATLGLYALSGSSHESELPAEESLALDTLVPEGHVLVPIEVSNLEALGSVVGPYGIVDLYTSEEGGSVTKVGSHLKMIRSPDQPSFISLLVPENEALSLLAQQGPYRVAVLNSQGSSSESELHKTPRSRIIYRDKGEEK